LGLHQGFHVPSRSAASLIISKTALDRLTALRRLGPEGGWRAFRTKHPAETTRGGRTPGEWIHSIFYELPLR